MKPLLLVIGLLCLSNNATADTASDFGELVELSVTAEGSDDFARYRGTLLHRVFSVDTEYTWGGSTCPGRDLTEAQVALLQSTGLAPYMRVQLLHKTGQGGSRCIVGFALRNVRNLP